MDTDAVEGREIDHQKVPFGRLFARLNIVRTVTSALLRHRYHFGIGPLVAWS